MDWISRNINYALVLLLLVAPFAVLQGCHKQEKMEIARQGQ